MKILPCTRDHVPAVVELLTDRPARADPAEHDRFCALFEGIYFDNPWYVADLPSLICEDKNGRLQGFLGVMHRPLVMNGKRIRAAMSSNFRVGGEGPKARNPLLAAQLMKAFFQGAQDISIAERANERGRRIWEGCGGLAIPLYSFDWFRPIRPVRALLELARAHDHRRPPSPFRLLADAADVLAAPLARRFVPGRSAKSSLDDLDARFAVDVVARVSDTHLAPHYDVKSLRWLLDIARQRGIEGRLVSAVVKDDTHSKIGWFVYVRLKEKEGIGLVLQLMALDGRRGEVFRALIQSARTEGVALLRGAVDVTDLQAYDEAACMLHTGRRWMLIHTPQPALVDLFLQGKALLTGLEGEWWLPPFQPGT